MGNNMEIREEFYTRFFGPITKPIMHSTDKSLKKGQIPHIDIYQFEPNNERDYWVLITSGMSDCRQMKKKDSPDFVTSRTEIITYIYEPRPWIFNSLKILAEYPFVNQTFLHWWHSVPGREALLPDILLKHFFFLPPYYESTEIDSLKIAGEKVSILWAVPITDAELKYKETHGGKAFEKLMEQSELNPVIVEDRVSIV